MKPIPSLSRICAEAASALYGGQKAKELESLVKEWIPIPDPALEETIEIGGYRVNEKNGNLIIILEASVYTKTPETTFTDYTALRFFRLGNEWVVSCDVDCKGFKELIQYLLDKQ